MGVPENDLKGMNLRHNGPRTHIYLGALSIPGALFGSDMKKEKPVFQLMMTSDQRDRLSSPVNVVYGKVGSEGTSN